MRANFYVDGFNLYYGCLRGTSYKWLDLHALCQKLLPKSQINRIRYFTARIQPRPSDPRQAQRQQTYLRALQTLPSLTIHYGHFLSRPELMPLLHPSPDGTTTAWVLRTEEKGSDVNLASYLLLDAFDGDFDVAAVVSNDSDLVEPIRLVQERFGLPVGVFSPHPNTSHALRRVAAFYRPVRRGPISASQFPTTLRDARGIIVKPAAW